MTRDQEKRRDNFMRLARMANVVPVDHFYVTDVFLEKFAEMVAAEEREACVEIVLKLSGLDQVDHQDIVAAIRARNEQEQRATAMTQEYKFGDAISAKDGKRWSDDPKVYALITENDLLREALWAAANKIEKLAFQIVTPNAQTPEFMRLAAAIRQITQEQPR